MRINFLFHQPKPAKKKMNLTELFFNFFNKKLKFIKINKRKTMKTITKYQYVIDFLEINLENKT